MKNRLRQTIFILSRGMRLAHLFAETARNLSSHYDIHVTLSPNKQLGDPKEEARVWSKLPGVKIHDLQTKIQEVLYQFKTEKELQDEADRIQVELGLPLYYSASNYLFYRRFSKQYFKRWHGLYDSESEILRDYVGSYYFFKELMETHRPLLTFCEMIDLVPHRVAHAVAHKKGIFAIYNCFTPALGEGAGLLASGTNLWSVLTDYYYHSPNAISPQSWERADVLLRQYANNIFPEDNYLENLRRNTGHPKVGLSFNNRVPKINRELPSTFIRNFSKFRKLSWLNKNLRHELPKEPYILFPLHHQPESNTKLPAPQWVDQDRVVEQIATRAPLGLKIVVKENPKTFGFRGEEYFGFLKEFPNVHLLHPSFDNRVALQKASAVLAISGTVGVEGILMRKRVGLLSPVYYSLFPGIRVLTRPEEILIHLGDPNWKPENYENELRTFMAAYIESSFNRGPSLKNSPWPDPVVGGKRYADALKNFVSITKQYSLVPESFPILL